VPISQQPVVDPNAGAPAQPDSAQPQDAGGQQAAPPPAEGQPTDAPAAPTAADAATATPAPTATPAVAELTTNDVVNVRGGPGTNYNLVGSAQLGTKFRVTGKSPDGAWWQIDYNGQPGWIFGQLVTATGAEAVAVAANIPAAPTAAPAPPPTATPAPPPADAATATPAPAQPAPDNNNYPFTLGTTEKCAPNPGLTYFNGVVRDSNNNLMNAVCIHLGFFGPRTTKCSGCDGVGDGNWGFSPFGGKPAPRGTAVEIYVVGCPPNLPLGGQNEGFTEADLVPQSPKWTRTINDSEQCTGITFYKK
jgi:hypothetical protein